MKTSKLVKYLKIILLYNYGTSYGNKMMESIAYIAT